MKYFYALFLIFALAIGANAADIWYGGSNIAVSASVENGSSSLPVRPYFEKLGYTVEWRQADASALISGGNHIFILYAGRNYFIYNGNNYSISVPAKITGGSLYAPLRAICEAAGLSVTWNGEADRILISDGNYDEYSLSWLSKIIEAEAGGESRAGKIAVGNVVLNRIADADFPSDVYSVIFDDRYGIQFTPVENGTVNNTPSADSVQAAKLCLDGYSVVGGCLYFVNPTLSPNSWASQNRVLYKIIGNHEFYC